MKLSKVEPWIYVVATAIMCSAIGWMTGYSMGKTQRPCFDCCVEGEMCQNEEEWAKVLRDCTGDEGDAKEMSKILDECWRDRDKLEREKYQLEHSDVQDLPALTKSALALAECRGALKECQRE